MSSKVTTKKQKTEMAPAKDAVAVERIQLGVRMEKSMVKVLKAMAELGDMSLGELLEEIVLHSFEGGSAQTFNSDDIKTLKEFKKLYGMNYDVHANYRFVEKN